MTCTDLVPLYFRGEEIQLRKLQKHIAIFFYIISKVTDVLCDRKMIKSQKTTGTMTSVLYDKDSFQFSKQCFCSGNKIPFQKYFSQHWQPTIQYLLDMTPMPALHILWISIETDGILLSQLLWQCFIDCDQHQLASVTYL